MKATNTLPAVPLVLGADLPVRKLSPELSLALALRLGLAVPPLPDARLLLLQHHRQRGVRRPQQVDLAAGAVVVVVAVRTAVHPGLFDVDGGGVGDGLALTSLQDDGGALLGEGVGRIGALDLGAVHSTQTHTGANDGDVLRVLQMLQDILGGGLLAEPHLQHRLVDVLAGDLPGQRPQLLHRGLEPMRLGGGLPLRAHDLLRATHPAAAADLADHHLAFPADPGLRTRVQHRLHVLAAAAVHGVGVLGLLVGLGGLLAGGGGAAGGNQLGRGLVLGEDGVGTQRALPFGRRGAAAGDGGLLGGFAAEEEVLDG